MIRDPFVMSVRIRLTDSFHTSDRDEGSSGGLVATIETLRSPFERLYGAYDEIRVDTSISPLALLALLALCLPRGAGMSTLTIRGVADELKARLRVRAAQHGRSMEAEVRAILHDTLTAPAAPGRLGSRIHQRFAAIGGAELEPPERRELPRAPELPG